MNTKQLRQKILDLAIRGKLVPQDPNDEPAAVLLERVRAEKERIFKNGGAKRNKTEILLNESNYEQLPDNWVLTCLGELFNLQAGKFVQASDIASDNSIYKYPCYGGNGLRGYVNAPNREGDYPLIGRQGALCGNINYATDQFYATEHAVVVKSFAQMNPRWAYYFLEAMNLNQYATATAQPGLSVKTINEVAIPLPPLAEQNRIVATIESVFAVIDEIERNKADLQSAVIMAKQKILSLAIQGKLVPQCPDDEPIKRIFGESKAGIEQMPFDIPDTWTWYQLENIGTTNIGLTYKPTDMCETGVPVLRSNNIKGGCFDFTDLVRVNTPLTESLKLNKGDIVICARNGSRNLVGKCAIINNMTEPLTFGAFMAVYRSQCSPYVYHFLNTDFFRSIFLSEGISTQINQLTQAMIKRALIPLPPLAEQKRIVAAIEAAFEQLDCIAKNISN